MASLENEQQKDIELDLTGVPEELKSSAKQAVGNYILDETVAQLAKGLSPVSREKFKKLNKDYAKKFKGGDATPNLYLDGDLQGALGYVETAKGIIFGVMDDSQKPKADGHNHFTSASANATPPKRRFIPGDGQDYIGEIQKGIEKTLSDYRVKGLAEIEPEDANILSDLNESLASKLSKRLR